MPRRMIPTLSYANVMSTLAMFAVLAGGVGYAATKIGSDDIRRGAVRAKHIQRNAVKTGKLGNDAVTGAKVDESTLDVVPEAAFAREAEEATFASDAVDSDYLGGVPASAYVLSNDRALARAGVNVNASGTPLVTGWFNRFGRPTVSHTPGSGVYDITMPTIDFDATERIAVATQRGTAPTMLSVTAGPGGSAQVRTFDADGDPADRSFYFVVF